MLQCRDIDDLAMDWLYEELNPDESADIEAHVESCARCAGELSSLKGARAAFRELPEEEPRAALSSILLHEAAQRAPSPAERPLGESRPGLLDRFFAAFRPVLLHPAAAAAAMLVIVAGVVGALYVRSGGHEVASPAATEGEGEEAKAVEGEEPPPASEPEEEAADAEGEAKLSRTAADGYTADLLDSERRKELEEKLAGEGSDEETGAAPPADEKREVDADRGAGMAKKKARAKRRARKRKKQKRAPRTANAVTGADPLVMGGGGAEKADRSAQSAGSRESADAAYRGLGERELRWAKEQEQRLSRAVAKKRCRRAAEIANDIRDRAPKYYAAEVSGSEPVDKCRYYVRRERKRRLARRRDEAGAADKATSAEKGAAEPTRAKSAPAEDQALEAH